jgi:serine/threonine protein kinase
LIQHDPEFLAAGRLKILRQVGEAIQELHNKDWIHIYNLFLLEGHRMIFFRANSRTLADIKPDNVLVNWHSDKVGSKTVSNAALGDFDLVFRLENAKPCNTPYAIGNAMWRSPEGQTGKGVTRASDIYSFGLVVS